MSKSSAVHEVKRSFTNSIGDIVFGMEDGTVSTFGLVFGVAAGTHNGSAVVLLAGATGAVVGAVAMMAGTYLDVSTAREEARVAVAREWRKIEQTPQQAEQAIRQQLVSGGLGQQEASTILAALRQVPGATRRFEQALEPRTGVSVMGHPVMHALWMFVVNLLAGFIPVIPFAFLPLAPARAISLVVTTLLLIMIGVARALVTKRPVLRTTAETLSIATAAAVAGVVIGELLAR